MIHPQIIILFLLLTLASCSSDSKVKEEAKKESAHKSSPGVSIAEIETGIKAYIAEKTKQEDGYFYVSGKEKELRLKLVRVHTEYLSNLGPKRHFACVDLVDVSGDVYDVDFFLAGDPGAMNVTETTLFEIL